MTTRPLNYTTKIAAKRTAGECLDLLAEAGAHAVSVTYADRVPSGLAFRLDTAAGRRDFSLPVDVGGVHSLLLKIDREGGWAAGERPVRTRTYTTRAHAVDVAWRVVRDWLEAQLALIAAQMATLDQVMLPYLEVDPGTTLYQRYLESTGQIALPGGAS
jgi:hypothetical protein